jgi:hypothetical protein
VSNKKKIKKPREKGYVKEALRIAATVPPGSVGYLEILHDDDCPRLTGTTYECTCVPDIRFVPVSSPRHGVN